MSATYAFRSTSGDIERMSPFGMPPAPHTMTPAAEAARASVRRHGARQRIGRDAALIVTDHGTPHVEPYVGPRPAAAVALAKKAAAAGWKVNAFETPGNVRSVVECVRGIVAFRATWHRGRAESGTWHERAWRYELVEDARPVGISKLTRVALAGKRPAGVGTTRLAIVASPWGIAVGVSEISKRVSTI